MARTRIGCTPSRITVMNSPSASSREPLPPAQGIAGDYFSVTWPGYAGVLTAMAPLRFAACLNQAPMWRRTHHPWLRLYDIAANGLHTWANVRDIPADQLLRQ